MTPSTLVTGGAGYIGAHTVRALRAAGREVVVLDTLELSTADAVTDTELIVGDVADSDLVERICRDHAIDTVVHFAAYKNVGESMVDPGKYFHNNVDNTVHLLDGMRRAGVERLVFSSSCAVYGTPERVPVDEGQAVAPESVYADTKAIVDMDVVADARAVRRRVVVAVHPQRGAVRQQRPDRNRDQIQRIRPVLTDAAVETRARGVEVAKAHATQTVDDAVPVQYPLDDRLRVGVDRFGSDGLAFVDGHALGRP